MNALKFVSLLALIFVLNSCTKEDPIEEKPLCDHVTLTVNNLLSNDLEDLTIGNVNYGTIPANGTEVLCLDESLAYNPTPTSLMLFANAIYESEEVNDGFFCGTGLMTITEGEFEMDITEVNDNFFLYNFK